MARVRGAPRPLAVAVAVVLAITCIGCAGQVTDAPPRAYPRFLARDDAPGSLRPPARVLSTLVFGSTPALGSPARSAALSAFGKLLAGELAQTVPSAGG
jgi:hypothetical protein